MEIPKEQILEMIRGRGDQAAADQAQQQLPDKVDTDQHSNLLDRFGINVDDLIGRFGKSIPGI